MTRFIAILITLIFVSAAAAQVNVSIHEIHKHNYYKTTGHRPGVYGYNPYQARLSHAAWQAQAHRLQLQRSMYYRYHPVWPYGFYTQIYGPHQFYHCR